MCTVRSILLLSSCFVCLSWNCQSVISMSLDMPMPEELPVATANLNINYKSEETGSGLKYEVLTGNYAMASPIVPEYGQLVHVLTDNGANDGCLPLFKNVPKHSQGKWIALIERGNCKFHNKVINAAFIHNASAVVVYNHVEEPDLLVMKHFIDEVVSVFISKKDGEYLAGLVDSGLPVMVNISLHKVEIRQTVSGSSEKPRKVQPLLIISVTLITCLIAGLSALLVCGIRRAKSQRKKTSFRHIVFTVNDAAAHQRLLMRDLPDYVLEPNNNDPNHNTVSMVSLQPPGRHP